MRRNVGEDAGKRTDPQRRMTGNGDMMLATFVGCQPHVASGLSGDLISGASKGADEVIPSQVAREPHAVMTSSRTK